MCRMMIVSLVALFLNFDRAQGQAVRGAFPSPSIQILPMMVAAKRGFYKREGLDLELIFVRGAATAVQALIANQIHFIFSIGPQMPAGRSSVACCQAVMYSSASARKNSSRVS